MRHSFAAASLLLSTAAWAAAPSPPPSPNPGAECAPLPALQSARTFAPGEFLEYELDAVGARAGKLTLKTLPKKDGVLPVEAQVETNTFFSKVRKVRGTGVSSLDEKTLRPRRYVEESTENDLRRTTDVTFDASSHLAQVTYTNAQRAGKRQLRYQGDAFDPVGAIFAFRHLPLREGLALCTDVYGIRRMWRLTGTIEGKENVSLPMGSFKAWHFSGTAQRIDNPSQRREIHVWISDDARRLPLAAVGAVDLGTVRATLTAFRRPGERPVRAEGKESLKW